MKRTLTWGAVLLGAGLGIAVLSRLAKQVLADRALANAPLTSPEQPVMNIPLTGPLATPKAEVSGLAWYQDYLIILPQYPHRFGSEGGHLFALSKAEILAFLDGQTTEPLEPMPIPFDGADLDRNIEGFQGYEAIAFAGNQAFLTVEAETANGMMGYLITGTLAADLSQLQVDPAKWAPIAPQSASPNKADEALLVVDEQVLSFYEVNGVRLNPQPRAHVFDIALTPLEELPFPTLDYRLTDVTALDDAHRFWAINYFFAGDRDLAPDHDPLVIRYGRGRTHRQQETVERLVEFVYGETGITLTETPPIQLELASRGRNWEGIVRLDDRGFLLMTDKFPETLLGYVAMPAR